MLIKMLHIFYHLLAPLLLTRLKYFYLVISMLAVTVIYILKKDIYDIIAYTQAISNPFVFEPGYATLSFAINFVINDSHLSVMLIQIILVILFFSLTLQIERRQNFQNRFFYLLFIVSSVVFTLGVNNILRQAYASVFLLWSFYFLNKKKYLLSFLIATIALLFHKSSILFFLFICESYFLMIIYYRGLKNKYFSFGVLIVLQIFLILCGVIALYILVHSGFYSEYANNDMGVANGSRILLSFKVLLLSLVFFISEYFIGNYHRVNNYFEKIRFLRLSFLILLFFLAFDQNLNELGSRVMFFYFAVELIFLIKAWELNYRKSVLIILLSYGFALNALNVLGGYD